MSYDRTYYQNHIKNLINTYNIVVFMKGHKLMPMCGFSNTVIKILNNFNIKYHTVNILEDEELRKEIKLYSHWPTIPQVYIHGEFIGGADIMLELYKSNKLKELLEKSINT